MIYRSSTLALFIVSFLSTQVYAANIYVRDGASGDGSSWSNALDQIPTLNASNRGDTVYVADGTYSGFSIDFVDSSTQFITVKKATQANHGSSDGWQSAYGDGKASFGGISLRANYLHFDGAVGGGAGNWRSGHGFKVIGDGGRAVQLYKNGGPSYSNIIVEHTEVTTKAPYGPAQDGIYMKGSNFTLRNNWIHDVGRVGIYWTNSGGGSRNVLIEQNAIERHGRYLTSPSEHSEAVAVIWENDDFIFRNNIVSDYKSTGGIILWGTNKNYEICGNVFFKDQGSGGAHTGIAGGQTASSSDSRKGRNINNIKIYNNTVYGIDWSSACNSWAIGPSSGVTQRNNMFAECKLANPHSIGGNHDYSYFRNINPGSEHAEEANPQIGSSNPFVNAAGQDFRLNAPTDPGQPFGSACNVDAYGKTRGADGNWDRGAYEYAGAGPSPSPSPSPGPIAPNPPTNITAE